MVNVTMLKKLTCSLAATVLIIGLATPRQAAAEDYTLARTIAAIAGLAVLGKMLHDHNTKDRKVTRAPAPHYNVQPYTPAPHYNTYSYRPRHAYGVAPRPLPKHVKRKSLPRDCLRRFETWDGPVKLFGQRCLERKYRHVHHLPQHCARWIRTDRGPRSGYAARCLRDRGYVVARR